MSDFIKPICNNCGHRSFRFSKRKGTSYCLTCGNEQKLDHVEVVTV